MVSFSFPPVRVVYCFDKADSSFCYTLDNHLAPLKQARRISTWDEQQILPGQQLEQEREKQFRAAHLFLLLVSADFVASRIGQERIDMALLRHQRGDAIVIPILVRSCLWEATSLCALQMLPRDHRALETRTDVEEAWREIAREISRVLDTVQLYVYLIAAPEDRGLLERLVQDIAREGVRWWNLLSTHSFAEHDFTDARDAMRQASSVVLIATASTSGSHVVNTQLELAADYQRPLHVLWVSGEEERWSNVSEWNVEMVLDARGKRYEMATASLLRHLKHLQVNHTPPKRQSLSVAQLRNPYKGLLPFTARDIRDFFGRTALVDRLTLALKDLLGAEKQGYPAARVLTVLGASGSGKSSVVLAGLLPQLQEGCVFNSREWIYLEPITPGAHPLEALAVSLARQPALSNAAMLHRELASDSLRTLHLLGRQIAGPSSRYVVLFLDQFEECLALSISSWERLHFFDLLVTAATEPGGPLLIVVAMRADFSARAMHYPEIYRLLDAHRVSVLPMNREELHQVIEGPASQQDVQLTFEKDLIGDLLFDTREEVGALPLLQFTLDQLYLWKSGQVLTVSAYREMGGVRGALARHAESTYVTRLNKEQQVLARSLFLRLIDPGSGEQDATRRRAQLAELDLPDAAQTKLLHQAKDIFLDARLLITNSHTGIATLEVSHEALIRAWPRLSIWVSEAHEDMRLQHRLSEDVSEWQQRQQPGDRLYRGTQLKEAHSWARRNIPSQRERAFLHASEKQRRQVFARIVSIILLLVAIIGGSAAWILTHRAPNPTLVTTTQGGSSTSGSLPWAIQNAPSGSTISFDPNLTGQTILLTDTLFIPQKRLTIQGPTAKKLIINEATHGISVGAGAIVTFSSLSLTGSQTNTVSLVTNSGSLTLKQSTVSGNTIASTSNNGGGGGIYNTGDLILIDSLVFHNATAPNGGDGGGIRNGGTVNGGAYVPGTLTLIGSRVISNTASTNGGGIYNDTRSTAQLTDSTVSNNTTAPDSDLGGGIANYGTLTLTRSTISHNRAGSAGGMYNNGHATLIESTVSDNTASNGGGGGGIGNFDDNAAQGILTLLNTTVSGNLEVGYNGGGLLNYGSQATLVFCTFYGNTAQTDPDGNVTSAGGGIFTSTDLFANSRAQTIMSNTLIAGNRAPLSPDFGGTLTTEGYNLLQNLSGTTFLDPHQKHATDRVETSLPDIRIDAHLQLNGSSTASTHALLPGSPAIDVIPLAACRPTIDGRMITTDQRNITRPQRLLCDIGAYEYVP